MRYSTQRAHVGGTYLLMPGNGAAYPCIVTAAREWGKYLRLFILPSGVEDAPPCPFASYQWVPVENLYCVGFDEYDAEGSAVFPRYERPTTLQGFWHEMDDAPMVRDLAHLVSPMSPSGEEKPQ